MQHEKITPAVVKEIGVPIYPGAKPASSGAFRQVILGAHAISAVFETSDDFNRVRAFYDAKYKSTARTLQFHIGPLQAVNYQFYSGVPGGIAVKGIQITGGAGETMISITSSVMSAPVPSPSPSPSPS